MLDELVHTCNVGIHHSPHDVIDANRQSSQRSCGGFEFGRKEGKHVKKRGGLSGLVAFLGLVAVANAQTPPSSTVGTKFDGTYAFVSATKMNETYTTMRTEHIKRCPDRHPKSLVILNGEARLPIYEGTVGSQGDLTMRHIPEPNARGAGAFPGVEVNISGRIDSDGTITAYEAGYGCAYDLIWRKQPTQGMAGSK